MKRGFTLLEMLVVIGIISVLATLLVPRFSAISENARSLRCKSKLKTLGAAALTYNSANGYLPLAHDARSRSIGNNSGTVEYSAYKGWVCGYKNGNYPSSSGPVPLANAEWRSLSGCLAITNGALWSVVGDSDAYLCETVKALSKNASSGVPADIVRTYVMNRFFGAEFSTSYRDNPGRRLDGLVPIVENQKTDWNSGNTDERGQPSKVLLFAEMAYSGPKSSYGGGALDYGAGEVISYPHKVGRREASNVCFADGHVETVLKPSGDVGNYIKWLCTGGICGSEPSDE